MTLPSLSFWPGARSGSIAKFKEIKDVKSKFKNDPIRLDEICAKSKQSEIVEGDDKDQYDASSSKKTKGKAIVYYPLG
ncbi:hypothetical protein H5410_015822 [Solanum commersonii]|uniref:Uncharacterized protein n=1 Tax=Solanum commersonii TaxID=4109 RepID=A0A9J5ZUR1_SOLCO|nr:hypothetical protein H5410_015822 [Solanum commersonii]